MVEDIKTFKVKEIINMKKNYVIEHGENCNVVKFYVWVLK